MNSKLFSLNPVLIILKTTLTVVFFFSRNELVLVILNVSFTNCKHPNLLYYNTVNYDFFLCNNVACIKHKFSVIPKTQKIKILLNTMQT